MPSNLQEPINTIRIWSESDGRRSSTSRESSSLIPHLKKITTNMHLRGIIPSSLRSIALLLLTSCIAIANDIQALDTYKLGCISTEYLPRNNSYFSPVRKVDDCQNHPFWCYEHLTNDKRYAGGQVSISEHQECPSGAQYCGDISFYSSFIKPSDQGEYMWHLISVPRGDGNLIDGYMINAQLTVQAKKLSRDEYLKLLESNSSLPSNEHVPVFIRIVAGTGGEVLKGEITSLWGKVVGNTALSRLVNQSLLNRKEGLEPSYDHTFYIFRTPSNEGDIGVDGWRYISNRTITKTGKAYGFVLNSQGDCIAADTVDIVSSQSP